MIPIQTAPKDGRELLLLIDNKWIIGTWYTWPYTPFEQSWQPVMAPYHGCGCCADNVPQDKVTHWLPLPEVLK